MTQIIVNLTQHRATREQIQQGVFDPSYHHVAICEDQTFDTIPSPRELRIRAIKIASDAYDEILGWCGLDYNKNIDNEFPADAMALIGGAPYFMIQLEIALRERGITPIYSFSKRESIEEPQPDGTTKKTSIFRHLGFVTAYQPEL